MAIFAYFVLVLDPIIAIVFFFGIYIFKVFSRGLVALPWQELIATVIPVSYRGRYWGSALILGKLMGMVGAGFAGLMLSNIAYPRNYSYLFLSGFVCALISSFS
jgi:hypothetical protein